MPDDDDDNGDDDNDDDDDDDDDHQMRRMVVMMMMIVVLCSLGAVLLHSTVLEFFLNVFDFNYSYSRNLMKCSNHTPMKISLAFGCPISVTTHP